MPDTSERDYSSLLTLEISAFLEVLDAFPKMVNQRSVLKVLKGGLKDELERRLARQEKMHA